MAAMAQARGVFATTDRGPWSQNLLFVLWSKITEAGGRGSLAKREAAAFVNELRVSLEGRLIHPCDRPPIHSPHADAY
jgi:hypothetical protein